jgi:hypothetical protein
MAEHEGITNDIRAREEEYFRRKDRELVERMRQAEAARQTRQELETRSGIHDPALLQELEELGFTPDTVSLLPLVPIVQVAWAEGGVSGEERLLIERFARERGIEPDTPAGNQLAAWLKTEPSEEVFARATRLIRAMLDDQSGAQQDLQIGDLIHHCEEIAAASGGVLGFRKISTEERALLGQIAAALKAR